MPSIRPVVFDLENRDNCLWSSQSMCLTSFYEVQIYWVKYKVKKINIKLLTWTNIKLGI